MARPPAAPRRCTKTPPACLPGYASRQPRLQPPPLPAWLQWQDPTELFGIGKYAADAYHMFCRGRCAWLAGWMAGWMDGWLDGLRHGWRPTPVVFWQLQRVPPGQPWHGHAARQPRQGRRTAAPRRAWRSHQALRMPNAGGGRCSQMTRTLKSIESGWSRRTGWAQASPATAPCPSHRPPGPAARERGRGRLQAPPAAACIVYNLRCILLCTIHAALVASAFHSHALCMPPVYSLATARGRRLHQAAAAAASTVAAGLHRVPLTR